LIRGGRNRKWRRRTEAKEGNGVEDEGRGMKNVEKGIKCTKRKWRAKSWFSD
jgi:hypothetical protein